MKRYRLDVEYVGTRYRGWQIQKNAKSVQGELQQAIEDATGAAPRELMGSGRTDAGVHALQQVAHVDLESRLRPDQLRWRINEALPPDVHVLDVQPADRRFHARHSAVARSYLYQVSRRRTAFAKPYVWWVKDALDARAMAEAARSFAGMHDYRSFTDLDPEEGSTKVLVESVELVENGALILVRIRGSHFLWKMVRRMVGVLVEVGRGGLGAADVAAMLRQPSETPARLTAPPSGLFLERVFYPGEPVAAGPLVPVFPITRA